MAGVPCDELIDFSSPEKKSSNMPQCFTPLVPMPLISSCTNPLDFVNYGSNPFDQLVEQSNFEVKNDPFEMVCKTAFQSVIQEKYSFSPNKFGMDENKVKNLLNTSASISTCVNEQFPDICASAVNQTKQISVNLESCDNANVDLLSSTHKIIDIESENTLDYCDAEKMKGPLNLDNCINFTDSVKLVDLPSPEVESKTNSLKIQTKELCNKLEVSHVVETKSNIEMRNDIYMKKSLNRSFSSAEEHIFRQINCVDTEKTVQDIVAERVEKCIQKALDDSRCYRTNSITNLNSSYSVEKVKLHRRSYSSSSVRDAEFISWLGLDKSRIKHRKSDFNIDVELSKFNNQCIADIRNLSSKKSFITSHRQDLCFRYSSNVSNIQPILSDISPIQGNGIHQIHLYKTGEADSTDNFSQVTNVSDEVFFEANLVASSIHSCLLSEDDIQSIKAPWERQNTRSISSEDCDEVEKKVYFDEVGKKDLEEKLSEKTTFLHSTPIPVLKGKVSSKCDKNLIPPYISFTPMGRKVQTTPMRLFPSPEETKKGPLKAIIPVGKMTKLQNTKGLLPVNTKADKSSNKDMASQIPSPNSASESVKLKQEKSLQNNSFGTDFRQPMSLRRIVSHGNVTGLKKSIQQSWHERSRSVDVKVVEVKQTQNNHKASRRVQSTSNLQTVKKEMKKSSFLKPVIRSSKIDAVQKSNSKISPLLHKVLPKFSTGSRNGKENITP